jgi:hypothetical protein
MKLRFIGGVADGQYRNVEDRIMDMHLSDVVHRPKSFQELTPSDEVSVVLHDVYTRRIFRAMGATGKIDEFHFMGLAGLTDMEVIRHQFSK